MAAWHIIRTRRAISLMSRRDMVVAAANRKYMVRNEGESVLNSHMTVKNEHLFPRILHDILAQILNQICKSDRFAIFIL